MQIKKNILENYLVWLVLFMGQTERRFHLLFSWPTRKFFVICLPTKHLGVL